MRRLRKVVPQLVGLVVALVALVAWAGWLGWDQRYDLRPDGSQTGPYEAWQVIGLVLTVGAAVYGAASRRHVVGAVVGPTVGLTVAAYYDWSDDASGLFMIGVVSVMVGTLLATAAASAVIVSLTRGRRGGRPAG